MSLIRPFAVSLLAAALLSACGAPQPPAPAQTAAAAGASPEQLAQAFDKLLDQQWQYRLQHSPEFASIIGDKRYDERWSDYSLAAVEADRVATADLLEKFKAIDAAGLDPQRQLSLGMMLRQLQDKLQGIEFKNYEMPLDLLGQRIEAWIAQVKQGAVPATSPDAAVAAQEPDQS